MLFAVYKLSVFRIWHLKKGRDKLFIRYFTNRYTAHMDDNDRGELEFLEIAGFEILIVNAIIQTWWTNTLNPESKCLFLGFDLFFWNNKNF